MNLVRAPVDLTKEKASVDEAPKEEATAGAAPE